MTRHHICSVSQRVQTHETGPEPATVEGSSSHPPSNRHLGLDLGRLVAAFFVVAIHAGPGIEAPGFSGEVFNQAARFAVPFFCCVSGFLFARSCRRDPSIQTLWRYERRILSLHVFWSAIYFLNPSIIAIQAVGRSAAYRERWENLIADPVKLLLEGTALHLWFLMALATSLLLVWLLNRRSALPAVLVGAALFVLATLTEAYPQFGLSMNLGLDPRDGPLFGMVFVALGYLTGWTEFEPDRRLAWSCFLGGALLHTVEIARLYLEFGASPFGYNFVFGTLFFGYGAFLLAIVWKPSGRLLRLAPLGPLATGIYCVHVLFVAKSDFFDVFFPEALWGFIRTVLVFFLALLASMLIARIPLLKRFVT